MEGAAGICKEQGSAVLEGVGAYLSTVPIIRYEIEGVKIDSLIWQYIEYGDLHWESASFSSGRNAGGVKDNLVGIEFATSSAARLGLIIDRGVDKVEPAVAKKGRRPSPLWPQWIAYLVLVSSDLSSQEGPEALMDKVADWMAEDGIDPPPRSTVQPAARAIIDLLRRENL